MHLAVDELSAPKVQRNVSRGEVIAVLHSVIVGLLVWSGEVVIGLLPLMAHELVARYSTPALGHGPDRLSAEVCILSVVVSGLALLSLLPFGPSQRKAPFSAWTYVLCLGILLSLIFGTMFYALEAAEASRGTDDVVWYTLLSAVIGSLALAVEDAILENRTPRAQPAT